LIGGLSFGGEPSSSRSVGRVLVDGAAEPDPVAVRIGECELAQAVVLVGERAESLDPVPVEPFVQGKSVTDVDVALTRRPAGFGEVQFDPGVVQQQVAGESSALDKAGRGL
jgi:hypothetical protein